MAALQRLLLDVGGTSDLGKTIYKKNKTVKKAIISIIIFTIFVFNLSLSSPLFHAIRYIRVPLFDLFIYFNNQLQASITTLYSP